MANRRILGVVAAEANSIEQRQILKGIITRAQAYDMHTVVLSNLYNPYCYDPYLATENRIYELISSPELCGIILIAESFTNEQLQKLIHTHLAARQDIPIVIVGIYTSTLESPNVRFLNTNDAHDLEVITRHLIEVHGCTQIDLLTGTQGNEAAELRRMGYCNALTAHGIPIEEGRIHYGDYWMSSGEALAREYASGAHPMPQAIVCANDYMAYGMIDTLTDVGIRVPEDIIVVGYEYILERVYHVALLSTYQRGRAELGDRAVQHIHAVCEGEEPPVFEKPIEGRWIAGRSCPCGANADILSEELRTLRTEHQYAKWNLLGTMTQQLTNCNTLDEFIEVLGKHHFFVRWVQDMFLCLFENWYDTDSKIESELLTYRNVMPWNAHYPAKTVRKYTFSALLEHAEFGVAQYYLPIFFEKKLFGYFVLQYNAPDTYDDVFRDWMKDLSNGLTFLCMKNDIRYLISCQNLSEHHDSLTGLYSHKGFERALTGRLAMESAPLYALALHINTQPVETNVAEEHLQQYQKIADLLQQVCGAECICARLAPSTFVCVGIPCESLAACEKKREKLWFLLLQQTTLLDTPGMEHLFLTAMELPTNCTEQAIEQLLHNALHAEMESFTVRQQLPHAETLFEIRGMLYRDPNLRADDVCKANSFSAGYFRQIYKDLFGISFHQDVITARIAKAVSLLTTSALSIASIAEACGYEDYNYFLRQFQKVIGMTPRQYRRGV